MDTRRPDNRDNREKMDIDTISFDRRKRAAEIIRNEEAEREKRRREQMMRRKAERIRRAKIARIKGYMLLGISAVGAVCIIIGIIAGIVKLVSASKNGDDTVTAENAVSAEEIKMMEDFANFSSYFYTQKKNTFISDSGKMLSDIALDGSSAGIPAVTENISEYGALSERYMFIKNGESYTKFREAVKNTPIYKNGYIWSETDSMNSSVTDGYFYDTNTSYIIAVANICLAEGSTSFLALTDTDKVSNTDASKGLTVSKKLDLAVKYLFEDVTDNGIRYSEKDSLCYIYTSKNLGGSKGFPSNRWNNFNFGYLDAYCNISFNKAMRALEKLYAFEGNTEKSLEYAAIADNHEKAFSEKFWNSSTGRFAGCIDKSGNTYDYGFVYVNLEAIEAGLATKEQQKQIFSWLDGKRTVSGDTSTGSDIYKFKFAPRNTTLAANDRLWNNHDGVYITTGEDSAGYYGNYYQNGGASLSTAYYDIMARHAYGNSSSAASKMEALVKEYNSSGFKNKGANKQLDISDNPLSALAPTAILKTVFGLDTDGNILYINPDYSAIPGCDGDIKDLGRLGIKDIAFRGNSYDFLYTNDALYITADIKLAVKIHAGGFEPGKKYKLIKVKNGLNENNGTELTADRDGFVSISTDFGADTYIKIINN